MRKLLEYNLIFENSTDTKTFLRILFRNPNYLQGNGNVFTAKRTNDV